MATFNGTGSGDILPNLLLGAVLGLGNDTINGLEGDDLLIGWTGNDILNGGTGADALIGGILNVVLNVGSLEISGVDAATYAGSSAAVHVDLSDTATLNLSLLGITLALTGATTGHGGDAEGDTLAGITNLAGSAFDDYLGGNSLDNALIGGQGDDTLRGAAGADTLNGGSGIDTATYAGSNAGVAVDLSTGAAALGHAQGDVLISIENLIGSSFGDSFRGSAGANRLEGRDGNDVIDGGDGKDALLGGAGVDLLTGGTGDDSLKGDDGDDVISGGDGRDLLVGGAGNDTMAGGAGTDIYYVEDAGDKVIEFADGGNEDRVYSFVSTTLAAEVETLVLLGSATDGHGNYSDNAILGNVLDNVLTGGAGSDQISGLEGDDFIEGGAGNDRIYGGEGADIFSFASLGDGSDSLADWSEEDSILIDLDAFGIDSLGDLTVVNGTSAVGLTGDVLFYQTNTARLYFHDGDTGEMTRFATLGIKPADLALSDFLFA